MRVTSRYRTKQLIMLALIGQIDCSFACQVGASLRHVPWTLLVLPALDQTDTMGRVRCHNRYLPPDAARLLRRARLMQYVHEDSRTRRGTS
jgi:hypothetical protein